MIVEAMNVKATIDQGNDRSNDQIVRTMHVAMVVGTKYNETVPVGIPVRSK